MRATPTIESPEALAKPDPRVRAEIFGEAWPLMWGMRNRIAHGYLLVDATIIRQTLTKDIPTIQALIVTRLDAEPPPGSAHATSQRTACGKISAFGGVDAPWRGGRRCRASRRRCTAVHPAPRRERGTRRRSSCTGDATARSDRPRLRPGGD